MYDLYKFPTVEDGLQNVEIKFCELLNKYREDKASLDPVEIDYMDWANTFIQTTR